LRLGYQQSADKSIVADITDDKFQPETSASKKFSDFSEAGSRLSVIVYSDIYLRKNTPKRSFSARQTEKNLKKISPGNLFSPFFVFSGV